MAVIDHNYCFRCVDIGYYGRNTDIGVFKNCSLYPHLENNLLLLENGVLVGDDAFPLKPYLLKLYKHTLNIRENIYNYRLTRAREIVENGVDILISRYRILGHQFKLKRTLIKIVLYTCTLHNWLCTTVSRTYALLGTTDYEDHEFSNKCRAVDAGN